ncbi:MAG: hypothetical protein NTX84_02950, partial [Nitrospirae bacterium]|nr:hypothetical protein [Nitrospirota bacterium]
GKGPSTAQAANRGLDQSTQTGGHHQHSRSFDSNFMQPGVSMSLTRSGTTDAKRMLDAYLQVELESHSNDAAKKHARTALHFANDLTHKRTASFQNAALCAEATSSVVNIVAIVSGQRNP